ncbi:mitochondrial fission 1 protein-like [Lingula anatina]|uniref:Mitochondrial fission 1 protein n=1 Tax=Lingula anatina TaxID=7574 RepID=A0A1S3H2Z9_LINAN|nr:mitochondrial fission 1 protein-like [Lingula anatina]|eukprot:XP_013380388.1 mitochondrial fission 1 protein-like [Lingula anatina]
MEAMLDETVSTEDLKKFEQRYNEQMTRGSVSPKTQFEYAWCLVRSKYSKDNQKGIILLEDLFHKTHDETAKRDYLYYLAVGNTRLKEYDKALKYVNGILQVQPGNHQAAELKKIIKKKMEKEGLLGMAIVGGAAAVALGSIIGLGVALAKK